MVVAGTRPVLQVCGVPGLSDEFKVAIVAGAVTGGGLTVIANAPNPPGGALLTGQFHDGAVTADKLLLSPFRPQSGASPAFPPFCATQTGCPPP